MTDYTVIDLEMTGLNPKNDRIIEIGAVRVRDGKMTENFERMVNPHRSIPEKIQEITGITDEDVTDGAEVSAALTDTLEFLGDDILVGHNIIFDYSFLKQEAVNEKISLEAKAVDTLKLARKFLPGEQKKTLEALCSYYGIARVHGHRACFDAEMTWQLYEKLKTDFFLGNEAEFEPKPLLHKAKRQTPATKIQKIHLKELLDYHTIEADVPWESLTKSEASRMTDQIISRYGRIQ